MFGKKSIDLEEHLAGMLAGTGGAYYLFHGKSKKEVVSSSMSSMLETTDTIKSLDDIKLHMDMESAQKLEAFIQKIKLGAPDKSFIFEVNNPRKVIEIYAFLKPTISGEVLEFSLWFRDITKRTLAQEIAASEQERLTQERAQFNLVMEQVSLPVWSRDDQLNIVFANAHLRQMVESENASDIPSFELYPNGKALAQLARASEGKQRERVHVITEGKRTLYEVIETAVKDGGTVGYALNFADVEQLQEDKKRYIAAQKDMLESSASGIAIFGSDQHLEEYNYAFQHLWKLDEGYLGSKPTYGEVLELLREHRKLPEQANFPAFKQQQLKLFTDLLEAQEEFFYLPDGRTLRVVAVPHALGGVLFNYEDVTDRLALERSFNTMLAVQTETLDNLNEAVAVYGENGRLKLHNPNYLTLWNCSKEWIATEPHLNDAVEHLKRHIEHDDWDALKHQMMGPIYDRKPNTLRLRLKNGKIVMRNIVPLPDGATLITYTDITDSTLLEDSLRERNEALEAADRQKTEFLANMSYELRSPLTSIQGFSEILKENYFGELNEKQLEYVNGVGEAANHLGQLITDILDLASAEAGYMELDIESFDVQEMLSNLVSLLTSRVVSREVSVNLKCPKSIGKMQADKTRIKQVLFHLISNAIQYTDAGGKIDIQAKPDGENLIFIIKDNGMGIPEAEQKSIFNTFHRTQAAQSKTKGTGLGLSVVKHFVELHDGKIDLSSIVGKGTTVTCILPKKQPKA
jgi:signal transduction histidine kinase